jgi:hypothetical protein
MMQEHFTQLMLQHQQQQQQVCSKVASSKVRSKLYFEQHCQQQFVQTNGGPGVPSSKYVSFVSYKEEDTCMSGVPSSKVRSKLYLTQLIVKQKKKIC